ncbi:CDP-glucose 4,6-dehydratase [bacterium BRH_c32]|nr:MAG: CDP-glucose 4,6-dehydratase [bacterium BRH_c32]
MESLVIDKLFGGIYKNKKVLITGHTGFKGSWLALWLQRMGAQVYGLALEPETNPNHYSLLNLQIESSIQDINDFDQVNKIVKRIKPDIIFHLAAQPLVRLSYLDPVNTFQTNVMGTVNILQACRNVPNLKAIVIITSDKCYENKEWIWGYRENETMGGRDPYSASKGCTELVVSAFRESFFDQPDMPLLSSARAGNVIGGGDWAKDRILTDLVSATSNAESLFLRYPHATRPWQFVLEPLSGYLTLGWRMLEGKKGFDGAWNFGPNKENNVSVIELVQEAKKNWDEIKYDVDRENHPHEAGFLMLDSTKADKLLNWRPVWGFSKTVKHTIDWYKEFYQNNKIISDEILLKYIHEATNQELIWCKE